MGLTACGPYVSVGQEMSRRSFKIKFRLFRPYLYLFLQHRRDMIGAEGEGAIIACFRRLQYRYISIGIW